MKKYEKISNETAIKRIYFNNNRRYLKKMSKNLIIIKYYIKNNYPNCAINLINEEIKNKGSTDTLIFWKSIAFSLEGI